MIKRIHIGNFKSLHDVTVELGPFTVLIGQNGAGKSSFLQAIQVLSWLTRYPSINDALDAHGLSFSELVYLRAQNSTVKWIVDLSVPDPEAPDKTVDVTAIIALAKRRFVHVEYELITPPGLTYAEASANARFAVGRVHRTVVASEKGKGQIAYDNVTLAHSILLDVQDRAEEFPILSAVATELSQFRHYEIWGPERLREPSSGPAFLLAERGGNLPSVLHFLRAELPQQYAQLLNEVSAAYPWFESIEFRRLARDNFGLTFVEKTSDGRKRRIKYQPNQVSDGFLRLLALKTLKYSSRRVSIVGYEEPENGMHPGMLSESIQCLRDVAKAGTQVIVTTHSPYLLQELLSEESGGKPEEELRLVWRGQDGKTVICPPSPSMLAKARAGGIGLGELWGMLLDEQKMSGSPARVGGARE